MERFLVHRAILNRVDSAFRGATILLQATFDQVDDGGLTTTDGTHEQEDAFAHLKALGGGVEVVDDLLERFFDTEDLVIEKGIAGVAQAGGLDACISDHMIDALMRKSSYLWFLRRNLEVLRECSFPHELALTIPVFF